MRTRFQLATFGFYFGIAGATAVLWAFPKLGPSTYWTLNFYRYFSALGFWAENYWYTGCFPSVDPIAEKLFLILGAAIQWCLIALIFASAHHCYTKTKRPQPSLL